MSLLKIIFDMLFKYKLYVATKPMELQEIKIVEDEVQENKTEGVDSLTVSTNMGNYCRVLRIRRYYSIE